MTSLEFVKRILRHCNPNSPGSMSVEQKIEVAEAVNVALADYFTFAPTDRSTSNSSVELGGPIQITLTATNGSNVISGYSFDPAYHGCTVAIGDQRNEIVSATTLLDNHQGVSGSQTATIYHDAVPFGNDRVITRITTDPWLVRNGQEVWKLTRPRKDHAPMEGYQSLAGWTADGAWHTDHFHYGDPQVYSLLRTGNSRGASDWFILKVFPSPEDTVIIRFNVEMDPEMIGWTGVSNVPVELPISPNDISQILRPLAEHELMSSTLWSPREERAKEIDREIKERYAAAMDRLNRIEPDRASGQNEIYTPYGY